MAEYDLMKALDLGMGYVAEDAKRASTKYLTKKANDAMNKVKTVRNVGDKLGQTGSGSLEDVLKEPFGKTVKPNNAQTVAAAGSQGSPVSAEAQADAAQREALYGRVTSVRESLDAADARRTSLAESSPASPSLVDATSPASVIRGTQQSEAEGPLYTEFIGENTKEGRAKAEAASIRRNVFHRPGDSDAVRIARSRDANIAADKYLQGEVGANVDRERIASTEKLGMANVGARYNEAGSRENVARMNNLTDKQIAEYGLTDLSSKDPVTMLANQRALASLQYDMQIGQIEASSMSREEKNKAISELVQPQGYE